VLTVLLSFLRIYNAFHSSFFFFIGFMLFLIMVQSCNSIMGKRAFWTNFCILIVVLNLLDVYIDILILFSSNNIIISRP